MVRLRLERQVTRLVLPILAGFALFSFTPNVIFWVLMAASGGRPALRLEPAIPLGMGWLLFGQHLYPPFQQSHQHIPSFEPSAPPSTSSSTQAGTARFVAVARAFLACPRPPTSASTLLPSPHGRRIILSSIHRFTAKPCLETARIYCNDCPRMTYLFSPERNDFLSARNS